MLMTSSKSTIREPKAEGEGRGGLTRWTEIFAPRWAPSNPVKRITRIDVSRLCVWHMHSRYVLGGA